MNAKQQREWEDDVTQPCAFPEPLAEVLTRENRELRAEVERLKAPTCSECGGLPVTCATAPVKCCPDCSGATHHALTNIRQRDELQGAQERLRRVRELADRLVELGIVSVYESAQEIGELVLRALDDES